MTEEQPEEEQLPPVLEPQVVTQPDDQQNQILSLEDHRQYSMQLYQQPAYVIDGALAASNMDPAQRYSTDDMKLYIQKFLYPDPPPSPPEGGV